MLNNRFPLFSSKMMAILSGLKAIRSLSLLGGYLMLHSFMIVFQRTFTHQFDDLKLVEQTCTIV